MISCFLCPSVASVGCWMSLFAHQSGFCCSVLLWDAFIKSFSRLHVFHVYENRSIFFHMDAETVTVFGE